jgi:hypothetical protein
MSYALSHRELFVIRSSIMSAAWLRVAFWDISLVVSVLVFRALLDAVSKGVGVVVRLD